jgi:hypothetical protein
MVLEDCTEHLSRRLDQLRSHGVGRARRSFLSFPHEHRISTADTACDLLSWRSRVVQNETIRDDEG